MKTTLTKTKLATVTASPLVRIGLGVAMSLLLLYLAVNNVDYSRVQLAFAEAQGGFVLLALLATALHLLVKAVRWQILVGRSGQHIALKSYLSVLLVGHMLNTLIPARVGDISRAYVLGGMGPGRAYTFGTIVIEKFLDMVAYALFVVLLVLVMPLPPLVRQSAITLVIGGAVVVALLTTLTFARAPMLRLLAWSLGWLPAALHTRLLRLLHASFASLDVLKQRADLFWLVWWTLVAWVLSVAANYFVLAALQLDVPLTASLLLLVALQAGIAVPISAPFKIGVFEWICVQVLLLYGVNQSLGFSYGLLLHTIVLVPATLVGLLIFWRMGLSRETVARATADEPVRAGPPVVPSAPPPAPQENQTP